MDWGDVPTWVASIVAVAALVIAWKARTKANDVESFVARQAGATEAVACSVAEWRAESEIPDVALTVEHVSGSVFRLRNGGKGEAKGLTVKPPAGP